MSKEIDYKSIFATWMLNIYCSDNWFFGKANFGEFNTKEKMRKNRWKISDVSFRNRGRVLIFFSRAITIWFMSVFIIFYKVFFEA